VSTLFCINRQKKRSEQGVRGNADKLPV